MPIFKFNLHFFPVWKSFFIKTKKDGYLSTLTLYQRQDLNISVKVLEPEPALQNPTPAPAKLRLHHSDSGSATLLDPELYLGKPNLFKFV